MNKDQITKLTLDALGALINQLPTKREKAEALGVLMIAGYNLLRTTEGDEFVRGWLESALADMKSNSPEKKRMNAEECARSLLALADWHGSPRKTGWGAGMMSADVMLTKDETMTVYVHRDALVALNA